MTVNGWLTGSLCIRLVIGNLERLIIVIHHFLGVCMCECKSIQTCGIGACIHPYRLMFIYHFTVILI